MKFNPITKDIYTDNGEFVKRMNCPIKIDWEGLDVINSTMRKCENCARLIVDTEFVTDDRLVKIIKQTPDACLKIDLNQVNIKIVSNGILEYK